MKETKELDKKERVKRKIIWLLAIIIVCEIICFSGYIFYTNFKENKDKQSAILSYTKQIQELKAIKDKDGVVALTEINSAFVGWLSCTDAGVELPIVQANTDIDENFYLTHDFYKEYNFCGVPYVKSGANIASTDNSTIVGHSAYWGMGSILANFYNYIDNANKIKNGETDTFNYTITIETTSKTYSYQVFSAFTFDIDSNYDTEYSIYNAKNFSDETGFNNFYTNVTTLSKINSPLTATYSDRFLTLMTCSKYSTNSRLMIVAKLMN